MDEVIICKLRESPVDSIKHYIKRDPLIAQCLVTVETITKVMKDEGNRVFLVKELDDFVGIVTEEDIVFKIVGEGKDPKITLVSSIMTQPIITIDQDRPVSEAREIMLKHKILDVVVTEEGKIVGVVYVLDLIDK